MSVPDTTLLPSEADARQIVALAGQSEMAVFLSDSDWIAAARALLIREGPDAVKIDRIAKDYGVSRGGFYWRFKNRETLLDRVLQDWVACSDATLAELRALNGGGLDRILSIVSLWTGRCAQAEYDLAIRGWGRLSEAVALAVARIDVAYLRLVEAAFRDAGYGDRDAAFRADILYNHYLGACASISIGGMMPDTSQELAHFLLDE